jgi:hypothetical protein
MFVLFIRIGYDVVFRRIAVEIGGAKRLYSLVTIMSTAFLTPLALLSFITGGGSVCSLLKITITCF